MAEPAGPLNIWTILLLISGVLVLAGFFLDWISVDMGLLGSVGANGLDAAETHPEAYIVPIMGILIIILPFIKLPIGSMIMGIIAFIIPIEILFRDELFDYIAIGAILVVVGGILAFIIGLLAWRKS